MKQKTLLEAEKRYAIVQRVGCGGMAEVFLARDRLLRRSVVLKRATEQARSDEALARMFFDEASTLAQFDHPNVVRIYDVGVCDGLPYMSMEPLKGWDLRRIMKHIRRLGWNMELHAAVRILADACRGLHEAHEGRTEGGVELHLVHRDVSPKNIFVTIGGRVKIIDFGIAKSTMQEQETRVGHIKGTYSYMSPEQFLREPLDRRSDVFSLGIILHELLTGEPLFGGLTPLACLKAVTRGAIEPPANPERPVPDVLVRITMKALEHDRAKRYASAAALAADLDRVAGTRDIREQREQLRRYLALTFGQSGREEASAEWSVDLSWTAEPTLQFGAEQLEAEDAPLQAGEEVLDLPNHLEEPQWAESSGAQLHVSPAHLAHVKSAWGWTDNAIEQQTPISDPYIEREPSRLRSVARWAVTTLALGWLLAVGVAILGDFDPPDALDPTHDESIVRASGTTAEPKRASDKEAARHKSAYPSRNGMHDQQSVPSTDDTGSTRVMQAAAEPLPAPKIGRVRIVNRGIRGRFARASLSWEGVQGAAKYRVTLCRVGTEDDAQACINIEVEEPRVIKQLVRTERYEWRVQAISNTGIGTTSRAFFLDARSAENNNARNVASSRPDSTSSEEREKEEQKNAPQSPTSNHAKGLGASQANVATDSETPTAEPE